MAIVAAGVHYARCSTGIGKAGLFMDRQRIDIGADAEAFFTMATSERSDDAMAADTFRHLISERQEITGDERRRARLRQRKLRMPVKIVPDGDAFLDEGKDSPFGRRPADARRQCGYSWFCLLRSVFFRRALKSVPGCDHRRPAATLCDGLFRVAFAAGIDTFLERRPR